MSWVDQQLMQAQLQLLNKKYPEYSYLVKDEMAVELRISRKTLDRRLKMGEDLPRYKESNVTGKIIFPISAIAEYYATDIVRTHI